jgi:hypothetical protein
VTNQAAQPTAVASPSGARLFVISLLLLYAEVMFIRWSHVELPITSVFSNLILIVVFVSTSVGLATCQRPLHNPIVIACAVGASLLMLIFGHQFHFYELSIKQDAGPSILVSCLVLSAFFACLTISFVDIGRLLGREFSTLPPLKAYSINLLGSLAGVLLFAVFSWLWLPPAVWLLLGGLCLFFICRKKILIPAIIVCVALCAYIYRSSVWSPYGKVEVFPLHELDNTKFGTGNFHLYSNNFYLHSILKVVPLSENETATESPKSLSDYFVSYLRFLDVPLAGASKTDRILVLGAGSGNDAAFALKHNPQAVTVVEIDPYISTRGARLHPDAPYLDKRVNVVVQDARAYLRYSQEKFDLIEFAFLDPGATLKLASFLCIDNFVYTRDAIISAINHLSDQGVVALSMAVEPDSAIAKRLYKTIWEAWGKPPLAYGGKNMNVLYMFGPGLRPIDPLMLQKAGLHRWLPNEKDLEHATSDDWPFLYLFPTWDNAVPYLLGFIAVSLAPLLFLARRSDISSKLSSAELLPLFFLGQAFMLVETKAVIKLSLLFGANWMVNSIVFITVLALAFVANWVVTKRQFSNLLPWYVCLAAALAADYMWVVPSATNVPNWTILVASAFFACLPIFFSGIIFSSLFSRTKNAAAAMAANTMGIACGGILEHACIFIGLRNLTLLVLLIYGLSCVSLLNLRRQEMPTSAQPQA